MATCLYCYLPIEVGDVPYRCLPCGQLYHSGCKTKIQRFAGVQKFLCKSGNCKRARAQRGELSAVPELLSTVIALARLDEEELTYFAEEREALAWRSTDQAAYRHLATGWLQNAPLESADKRHLGIVSFFYHNASARSRAVHYILAAVVEVLTLTKPESASETQASPSPSEKEQWLASKRTAIYATIKAIVTNPTDAVAYQQLIDWREALRGLSGQSGPADMQTTQKLVTDITELFNGHDAELGRWADSTFEALVTAAGDLEKKHHPLDVVDITERTWRQLASWIALDVAWALWPGFLALHTHSKVLVAPNTPGSGSLPPGPDASTEYKHISTWEEIGKGGIAGVTISWVLVLLVLLYFTIFGTKCQKNKLKFKRKPRTGERQPLLGSGDSNA